MKVLNFGKRHGAWAVLGAAAISSLAWFVFGTVCRASEAGEPMAEPAARAVKTYTVARYEDSVSETFLGRVRAPKEVNLAFSLGGTVERMDFRSGDWVEAGETIARLDATIVRQDLAEARERLAYAELNGERMAKLFSSGSVPRSENDRAANVLALARIAVDRAEERLADCSLVAPFAGRVAGRIVEPGSYVNTGTAVVVFQQAGLAEIDFYQTESQLSALLKGVSNGTISVFLPGQSAGAELLELKDYATAPHGRTGAYRVTVRLGGESADELFPGAPVRVEVRATMPEGKGVVRVPADALVCAAKADYRVWVLPDGARRAEARSIILGRADRAFVEVLSGLRPGERIVTAGATMLSADTLVTAQ